MYMRLLVTGSCIVVFMSFAGTVQAGLAQSSGDTAPAATSASTAPPAAPGAAALTGTADANSVVPGPLEEQRKALLDKIDASKRLGIGVGPYMAAFGQVEGMVKSGAPQDAILTRLNSIRSGLLEQVERIKEIKSRPALTPTAVSPSAGASGSGGGKQQLIEQLKQKIGDKFPGGLDNPQLREKLSDPEARQKLLDSPLGQKLLNKLQGQ